MSIAKLIEDFITNSAKSSTPVADLLEQARTIADLIDDKKFAKFCERELNGYAENEKLPDYRQVNATLDIWYDGPLIKADAQRYAVGNPVIIPCWNPIKDISSVVASGKDYVSPVQDDKNIRDYKNRTVIKLFFLQRIENEVRKKINEWKSSKIKEGKFSLDSDKGTPIINNYGNINGANIIGSMTNSSATINNNNSFDFKKVSDLIEQVLQNIASLRLTNNQEAELKSDLVEIKQMVTQKDETGVRKLLHKIEALCQNITGSLVATGIISQISQILE